MNSTTSALKRALAASTAVTITGLGVVATAGAAAADPGNGKGSGQSQGQARGHSQEKSQGKAQEKSQGRSRGTSQEKSPGSHGKAHGHDRDAGPGPAPRPTGTSEPGRTKPAKPQGGDPAGNNGTVKVTPHGEVDGIPQNTPHFGCVFDIEWYGFDEGDDIISRVTFEAWAPTRVPMSVDGPAEVFVGEDPASGAGTDSGFDGEATYRLSFDGEPHPQQGYHVKLTINTPGAIGADVQALPGCADGTLQPEGSAGRRSRGAWGRLRRP